MRIHHVARRSTGWNDASRDRVRDRAGEEVARVIASGALSRRGALAAASAVAVTVFCCLPFAAGIVGAGVAALGARLAPARPYLAVVSVGCLGYAFYQAYRRRAHCEGENCNAKTAGRFQRATVWLVALVVVLLLTFTWWASWLIYWTL